MARSSRYASCHLFYYLYIVGPAVLLALSFFNLTFIALGNSYIPTEELLDKEENIQRCGGGREGKTFTAIVRRTQKLYPKQS